MIGEVDVLLRLVEVDSVWELDEGQDDESMNLGGESDGLGGPVSRGGGYEAVLETVWRMEGKEVEVTRRVGGRWKTNTERGSALVPSLPPSSRGPAPSETLQ